jgi:hypothetical protein
MNEKLGVHAPALVEDGWRQVLSVLGFTSDDLDRTARCEKALLRRRRVQSGSDLLRLAFAYALLHANLQLVGKWAAEHGIAALSAEALSNRLRGCRSWLGSLLAACLVQRRGVLGRQQTRLRLIDATTASRPGSTGTDWRVHISLDLGAMCMDEVELTDVHGGETFSRHGFKPGDILVADAGYGHRTGLAKVFSAGAAAVVRTNWSNLPLCVPSGKKFLLSTWLDGLGSTALAEHAALVVTPKASYPVRVIAGRLTEKGAGAARRRSREQARKKKHRIDERTLKAAAFILLVTSLPADSWSAEQILELYRLRWQVELHFKRLKSILHLDDLRVQSDDLAQSYLLSKLLAAFIVEELIRRTAERYPNWFLSPDRPVSYWRLTYAWRDYLVDAVRGHPASQYEQSILPGYQRYYCDSPRKRASQSAQGLQIAQARTSTADQLPLPCQA